MSMEEWMKLIADSAKHLPDETYERIANRSAQQTSSELTNTDIVFVYSDFEYSHTTSTNKDVYN